LPDSAWGGRLSSLSVADGLARVTFRQGDATLTREAFISAPDDVPAVRVKTDKLGTLAFTVSLTRKSNATITAPADDQLHLDGQIVDVEKKDGGYDGNAGGSGPGGAHMRFAGRLLVRVDRGKVAPAAPAGTQPRGHVDESLLAAARAKSLAAKQKASPVHTHTTAGPRLPTDETIDPDDSAKPRDPNRPSRDEAPAATPADMLPPPADPEDEADPAAIAPAGGLRPAPLGGQRQAEESTSRPKTAPRFRRWWHLGDSIWGLPRRAGVGAILKYIYSP